MLIEVFKASIFLILLLAVYAAHIDLQSQILRFHRRKQTLKTPITTIIKKPPKYTGYLPTQADCHTSTETFTSGQDRSIQLHHPITTDNTDISVIENITI